MGWLSGWLAGSLVSWLVNSRGYRISSLHRPDKSCASTVLFVKFISEVTCLGKMFVNRSYVKLLLPGISLNDRKVVEELSVI